MQVHPVPLMLRALPYRVALDTNGVIDLETVAYLFDQSTNAKTIGEDLLRRLRELTEDLWPIMAFRGRDLIDDVAHRLVSRCSDLDAVGHAYETMRRGIGEGRLSLIISEFVAAERANVGGPITCLSCLTRAGAHFSIVDYQIANAIRRAAPAVALADALIVAGALREEADVLLTADGPVLKFIDAIQPISMNVNKKPLFVVNQRDWSETTDVPTLVRTLLEREAMAQSVCHVGTTDFVFRSSRNGRCVLVYRHTLHNDKALFNPVLPAAHSITLLHRRRVVDVSLTAVEFNDIEYPTFEWDNYIAMLGTVKNDKAKRDKWVCAPTRKGLGWIKLAVQLEEDLPPDIWTGTAKTNVHAPVLLTHR